MLYSIDSGRYIGLVPHQTDFKRWKYRLDQAEYDAVFDDLDRRVATDEIHTSSWIPGADWTGTVFQVLYEKACLFDEEAAARFFGLILWDVMIHRSEVWAFGRYEKDGNPIAGLTYFKLNCPPT